jgi:hypothetical protein
MRGAEYLIDGYRQRNRIYGSVLPIRADVVSRPDALTLITLDEAKAHLRVLHTEEDALITGLIASAIATCEHKLNRFFLGTACRLEFMRFPDDGRPFCTGHTRDITAVNSISYVDTLYATKTHDPAGTRIRVLDGGETFIFPPLPGGTKWPTDELDDEDEPWCVRVEVSCGIVLNAAIKSAALLLIGHLYENREAVVVGTIASDLPMAVSALLDTARQY